MHFTKTVKCPFCNEEIQDGAVKCRHCLEILNKDSYAKLSTPPEPRVEEPYIIGSAVKTSAQSRGTQEIPSNYVQQMSVWVFLDKYGLWFVWSATLILSVVLFFDIRSEEMRRLHPENAYLRNDVAGHWSNDSDMTDFTLNSNGTCSYSFAGHDRSRGSWRLSGSSVIINLGDGGEPVSFVYKNGKLTAPNGHYLTPK
jgi:hypothetical protein